MNYGLTRIGSRALLRALIQALRDAPVDPDGSPFHGGSSRYRVLSEARAFRMPGDHGESSSDEAEELSSAEDPPGESVVEPDGLSAAALLLEPVW